MGAFSDNVGDANIAAEGASQPVRWTAMLNPLGWTFLAEPAWKWFFFMGALILFATAWKGVLRYMK